MTHNPNFFNGEIANPDLIAWIALAIIIAAILAMWYFGAIVHSLTTAEWEKGWKFYCNNIRYGDNSTEGYSVRFQEHCLQKQ